MIRRGPAAIHLTGTVIALWLAIAPFWRVRAEQPAYRDASLPIEQRVVDLLARMTIDEKIAQLLGTWQNSAIVTDKAKLFVDARGAFVPELAATIIPHGVGQMTRPSEKRGPREMAEFTNIVQRWAREQTRLGIPILFHEECLHGHAAPRGTSYPQPIALASTWNPDLVHDVFAATAAEVRARGAQQCLAPVLDLARDPRWGRTEETYGEDPYLVTAMGVAAIRGLQGPVGGVDRSHVMATAKHFAVHGQPEGGTNVAPGNYSERVVREHFLRPFEAAVRQARVRSVMASYNEIDGVPSHANAHLLNGILRGEWGFDGLVVSDYFGINDLLALHRVAATPAEAARLALAAGVDIELPFGAAFPTLAAQVNEGSVALEAIDRAVARGLRTKFEAGLFDDPYVDPETAERITNDTSRQQLALRAARESIVLLKNDSHLLPLAKGKYRRVAVIGPNAAAVHQGGYSDNPGRGVSILDGVRAKVGTTSDVLYAEGCRITETEPDWYADKVVLGDPALNAKRIREAVQVAGRADVVLLVLGENEQTSREAWAPTHLGDRDSLDLLGNQDELVDAVLATGRPTIVLLLHGRPNTIRQVAERVPAILEGWYLGQEGGTAVADVLFGDYNPGGRLPITVPRSVGQIPSYYYQKPSAKRGFLGTSIEPLFAFGWGLSYTTFKYANLRVTPETIGPQGEATVTADITNTGGMRGDEVVQLYIRDEVSSVTRPVRELRGFRRLTLDPGGTATVEFKLGPAELSFLDLGMHRIVEPGTFTIMVGGNQSDVMKATLTVVAR